MSIYPLTYRKGMNYWSVFTRHGVKLFTVNFNMDNPEEIARTIVEATNKYMGEKE